MTTTKTTPKCWVNQNPIRREESETPQERTAGQADHIKKGRTVAIDGQLTQHDYLTPDGHRQTRTAIRADRLQLLDAVPGEDCA